MRSPGRLENVERFYSEPVLDAASKHFRGTVGLQELLLEAAWANGYDGRSFRDSRMVLAYAFGRDVQAGLSNVDIGGILSNVANKFLLEGFYSVERTWRNICAVRNVSDFKTVTSYRLIGRDQYEMVAPGGEFKHGTLGEESYTNKADTYGLMLAIDRRDIINDDLGAITLVPRKHGRGSGLKINDVFWTAFMNNAAFFTAGNKNYITGATTALGIDGLTAAETAFMEQVDSDGKPIGVMPVILLVPPALSAAGTALNKSLELRDTTASTKYPIVEPAPGQVQDRGIAVPLELAVHGELLEGLVPPRRPERPPRYRGGVPQRAGVAGHRDGRGGLQRPGREDARVPRLRLCTSRTRRGGLKVEGRGVSNQRRLTDG